MSNDKKAWNRSWHDSSSYLWPLGQRGDFLIEAEVSDLLVLVLLDWLQVLLSQDCELLVVKQDVVIDAREVLDHFNFAGAHRCGLIVLDGDLILDLRARWKDTRY